MRPATVLMIPLAHGADGPGSGESIGTITLNRCRAFSVDYRCGRSRDDRFDRSAADRQVRYISINYAPAARGETDREFSRRRG